MIVRWVLSLLVGLALTLLALLTPGHAAAGAQWNDTGAGDAEIVSVQATQLDETFGEWSRAYAGCGNYGQQCVYGVHLAYGHGFVRIYKQDFWGSWAVDDVWLDCWSDYNGCNRAVYSSKSSGWIIRDASIFWSKHPGATNSPWFPGPHYCYN